MRSTWLFTTTAAFLILASSILFANEVAINPGQLTVAKENGTQIETVKSYLSSHADNGHVRIWIYFTDKNIFDNEQFAKSAATVAMTDHARARRAKMGREKIDFADLPVNQDYLNQITAAGGKLRQVLRWLNAASFDVALTQVDAINALPFVARVRPVATLVRPNDVVELTSKEDPSMKALAPFSLNYGSHCIGQLNQIKVPAVHNLGYNGAGVIVAMFDTGFKKAHEAFAAAYSSGRVLAEHDFIFNDGETDNEAADSSNQHDHGTYTWSTLGGAVDGKLYGPAYGASFILAKTEYVPTETRVEEDNWAAAVEWVDSIGADVISSSLGYSDWYTYASFDGHTAVTTIAANRAESLGIVVCNAMGNEGPNSGTLSAPADAYKILSIGAVSSSGTIASFSSRGPTYDGRMKPEVCAQGVSTYCASATGTTTYASVSGTSLSTPLMGGCAAVLLSARPTLTPELVRMAFMQTASRASSPDNTYGWGIANLQAALGWGAHLASDVQSGTAPLTVSFTDSSYVASSSRKWLFGDGDSSLSQNPVHVYTQPGVYDVSLNIVSDGFSLADSRSKYILVTADTLTYSADTVYAGDSAVVTVSLTNTEPLYEFFIPVDYSGGGSFLSLQNYVKSGMRAEGFTASVPASDPVTGKKLIYQFTNNGTPLAPGSGPIMKLIFYTDEYSYGGLETAIDTVTLSPLKLDLVGDGFDYIPKSSAGRVVLHAVKRGDANNDGTINVGDAVYMINYIFKFGSAPRTIQSGDANYDYMLNVGDPVYLINYIFKGGSAPHNP